MSTKLKFETIWDRIEHRMKVRKITQAEVSRRAGWKNDANLRNIKSGRTQNPKSHILAAIARVLGTSESWLREEYGPEDRTALSELFTGESGAELVEEAQCRAVQLSRLLSTALEADGETQDRLIFLMKQELSAIVDDQSAVKSKHSKSRG